ncbi:hypothetical protein KL86DPRO_11398 [uncultured delta proteobacterium]|uniref:Uncharacterized protein n=1 Tax=uncultured delta proteobacterium TaxID=34034 RepID=A0A212JGE0_9DELT|nr:hypothetical protein KL86DPRO_11398 [uncultured delta proteobacterium]
MLALQRLLLPFLLDKSRLFSLYTPVIIWIHYHFPARSKTAFWCCTSPRDRHPPPVSQKSSGVWGRKK